MPISFLCDVTRAVPKGGIEKGESSGQAAVREAWEEGLLFFTSLNQAIGKQKRSAYSSYCCFFELCY